MHKHTCYACASSLVSNFDGVSKHVNMFGTALKVKVYKHTLSTALPQHGTNLHQALN